MAMQFFSFLLLVSVGDLSFASSSSTSESMKENITLRGRWEIPVFYNLFVNSSSDIPRVKGIVQEQMALVRVKHRVFVQSIGTPMSIPNTTLISHHDQASEMVTLDSLWNYCRKNRRQKVIYLHSKGSFHPHILNDVLRMFLTRGALSKECANLPFTCNVCSSRMSPVPHPHTPGNMWLARCNYVSKLLAPRALQVAMNNVTETQSSCRGTGRYAAEHWVYSHPAARPCDLYTDPAYTWAYKPVPEGDFRKELKPAPRFSLETYDKKGECKKDGLLMQQRLEEYQMLYQTAPTDAWWGWDSFGRLPTDKNIVIRKVENTITINSTTLIVAI
jgi:hypothetical protein